MQATTQASVTRSQQLSEKELKSLRMTISRLTLPNGEHINYSLATKQTRLGLSSNERLLVLNNNSRSLCYLREIPPGLIPFLTEEEVNRVPPKIKVTRQELDSNKVIGFKCAPVTGRNSTFSVSFIKKDEKEEWILTVENAKMMNDWVQLINMCMIIKKTLEPVVETHTSPIVEPPKTEIVPAQLRNSRKLLNETPYEGTQQPQIQPNVQQPNVQQPNVQQPNVQQPTIVPEPVPVATVSNPPMLPNPINNSNPPPFTDHVSQLQYLRREKPRIFNTTNELSYKNLPPYEQNIRQQPQRKPSNRYLQYEHVDQPANTLNPTDSRGIMRDSSRDLRSRQIDPQPIDTQQMPRQNQSLTDSNAQRIVSQTMPQNNQSFQSSTMSATMQPRSAQLHKVHSRDIPEYEARHSRVPSKKMFNRKRWNEIFAETGNKLQVYEQFIATASDIVRTIIDELPLPNHSREYAPIDTNGSNNTNNPHNGPIFSYVDEGIMIQLHSFENEKSQPTSSLNGPVLYSHSSYYELQQQFNNYNIILSVTGNQGFIKVPLAAYFQYKGMLALCKAEMPEHFQQVSSASFEKQFEIIEQQIKTRFQFSSFVCSSHPNGKYVILNQLYSLIPSVPNNSPVIRYFRKELLLGYPHILQDLQTCVQAHNFLLSTQIPQLISQLQNMETFAVCARDLLHEMHYLGMQVSQLTALYQQTDCPYFRRVFASQMVSEVFTDILRSQLNRVSCAFPAGQFESLNLQVINSLLLDGCCAIINNLFSYSNDAEGLWRTIVEQVNINYRIVVSREDIIPGYLLSAIISANGLVCDFRGSQFDYNADFFIRDKTIPRELLVGFMMQTERYSLNSISGLAQQVEDIVCSEPSPNRFRELVQMLNLQNEAVPGWLESIEQSLVAYLCNFVPYSEHEQFQHMGIYNMVLLEPHSRNSLKVSLLAVKWCIKKRIVEQALKIFQMKSQENHFWLGEFNPSISEFYDFFSMYYASVGKYEQAIQLAKSSLVNIVKVLGATALPVADKHYQLGNIYFKLSRKEDALKEYIRTHQILLAHAQTQIPEYGIILLKLALLNLNFGKVADCVNGSLEALKVFELDQYHQQEQIETFEILARCYQITRKANELRNIGNICSQKFNNTDNLKIFERMTRIFLYQRLRDLSAAETKATLAILTQLYDLSTTTSAEAFAFLQKQAEIGIVMRRLQSLLDNISTFHDQASRKDLFRKYRQLDANYKTEAQFMLVMLDAVAAVAGYPFLIGTLKEGE